MDTYVLVHGAWHSGDMLEGVASCLRREGHKVYTPTLAGNRPGDSKAVGLEDAIESLVDCFRANDIRKAVLAGHSYGGMVITGAADRLPEGAVRRLVYWSAFVPNDGESLEDISAPSVLSLHDQLRCPDGSLALPPFAVWRDLLINDADIETAQKWYQRLNPHPHNTMRDKIRLSRNPAEMSIGKSYIYCRDDACFPASHGGWHPRFTEKLGVYRFLSMDGSHEVCLSKPDLLAEKFVLAARV